MKNASHTPRLKKFALVSALTIVAAGLVAGAMPGPLRETFAMPIARILFSDPAPVTDLIGHVQSLVPIVTTEKTDYLAGEDIVINAAGFLPTEAVTINLSRANGEPVQTWNVIADANGQATATWAIDPNDRGLNDFLVVAEGPSGTSQTEFSRIAVIHPNKFKFEPGEAVFVRGAGFRPGEEVLLEITRVNLDGTNTPKEPFYLTADDTGAISAVWTVDPEDADGAIYRMVARGITSSVMDASVLGTGSTFLESPVPLNLISEPISDDGGPDDLAGQKDLTQLQEDDGPDYFAIAWNWDDTAWSGGNTGDACALIDTDADGNANYAFCVTIHGKPAHLVDDAFYSCGDDRADRCTQDVVPIAHAATSGVSLEEADPFWNDPEHTTGNNCKDVASPTFPYDCRSYDAVASVSIPKTDLGGATDPRVVNVCSYPSQEPNSDPSDCVFNPQNGLLVITKVADPNDGTAFVFNASRQSQTGLTQWTINGSGSTPVISYSSTSTVDLTEVVPTNWSLTSASCSINTATPTSTGTKTGNSITGISIQPGLTTTCTFNDALQTGSIKIVKNTIGGDGTFSFTPTGFGTGAFDLTTAAGTAETTFENVVSGGTYSISESVPTGWDLTSSTCTNGTPSAIVVAAGATTTCTFTNTKRGTIVVDKMTLPAADAESFDFTTTGTGYTGFSLTDAATPNSQSLAPGTYTVSETAEMGWNLTDLVCVDPTSNTTVLSPTATIDLAAGETVTCTFTNTKTGTIIVEKQTIPDESVGMFTFTGDVSGTISDNGQLVVSGLSPGTYTSTEIDPAPNFDLTSVVCDDGTSTTVSSGDAATRTATFRVDAGETVKCTFTNTQRASLTLVKEVINDNGGTAVIADWTLSAAGTTPISGAGGATGLVKPGVYTLSESAGPAGYTPSAWSCNAGSLAGSELTLGAGVSATCTITNNDNAPSLTLQKIVVNDNGGNADASNFTLTAAGPTGFSGSGPTVNNGASFDAGTYALSETGPAGYRASDWVCTGGTQVGANITLGLGQSATCSITNDDIAPTLTLVKTVNNDDGGNAVVSDFPLFINASPATSGQSYTLSANTLYTATETNLAGYSPSAWGGDCAANGTITLNEGDNKTCTITNDDVAPTLKLVKNVVNDNGGTLVADDFTLSAAAGGPWDDRNFSTTGGSGTFVPVFANQGYGLSETVMSGYTAGNWICSGGTLVGAVLTLNEGETGVTCSITNNDIAPTLTVIKYIYPASDTGKFNLRIDDVTYAADVGHTGTTGPIAVNAGLHTVSETAGTGTNLSNYIPVIGGACASNGQVSLALAENKVCTIINTRRASLTIVKSTEGGNGTFDFTSVSLGNFSLTTVGNTASTTFSGLVPGFFDVQEIPEEGWDFVNAVCSDGSNVSNIGLSPGENVTCTFTNRQRGRVNVLKTVNGSPDPDLNVQFQLFEGTTLIEARATFEDEDGMLNFTTDLLPGTTYTMCEVGMPAGFGFTWMLNSDPVTPYNPDDPIDNRTRCYDFSVTAGQTAEFAVNNTQPLLVSKTAATSYTRTYNWDITKAASPASWDMFKGDSGTSEYTVTVSKTGPIDSDWAVAGTITIMNPSKVAATIVSVTDVVSDAGSAIVDCGEDTFPHTLGAESSMQCNYQANLPDAASRTNTATVVTSGPVPGGSANAAVAFGDPTTVVNDSINVTDTNGGSWAFNDSATVSYTKAFYCSDDEGTHNNTATITQTSQSASASVEVNCYDLNVSKTAHTSLTRTFDWTIDKSVDHNSFDLFKGETGTANYTVEVEKSTTDSDWAVAGIITINNPAPVAAYLSDVIDIVSDGSLVTVDCSQTARGLSAIGYMVPAGENFVCSYRAALDNAADRTNTATAMLQNFSYSSSGTATPGGTTNYSGTADISFGTATVRVVGFDTVNVTDSLSGSSWNTSEDATWTYPDTYTCGTGINRQNTARITETGESDTESVTYNCYELQVAKTAAASFRRDWDWSINKSANVSALTLMVGQSETVNYSVFVAPHSTSRDYRVTGNIVVTNTHPSAAAEVTVTDLVAGGYPGVVNCETTTVEPAGSITCTYTADLPNETDRLNTATVEHGTFATYTANALVDFSGPTTETDETVNVNDTLQGFLGTRTGPIDGQNTYRYSRTIGPFAECGTYQVPNTASFVTNDTETTGSDGHNVTVTVPCGTILVRKVVLSPNAADTPDDFSYTFNGGSPITFNANGTSPTPHVVNPGTYTIAEPVTNGFVASYSGDCNAQGQITAVGGETKTCTITNVYLTGFVTSSSLCTFDVDNDASNGNQFRLLLTPDVQLGYGIYKLNASNPGQYYYNVLHYNPTAGNETVTLTIPFPFVTQGATPLHVYNGVTTQVNGSSVCLLPGTELFNQQSIITLADYGAAGTFGSYETVDVSVPPGFTYINIHLDYGLKRTTNYIRGASDLADNQSNNLWDIINGQGYTFSNGGSQTVHSVNEFKKNPGVAGLTVTADTEPIPGSQIELWLGTKRVGTTVTDADGWYQIYYKHLGKAQTFYVKWVNNGSVIATKQVQLKANGFAEVSFP